MCTVCDYDYYEQQHNKTAVCHSIRVCTTPVVSNYAKFYCFYFIFIYINLEKTKILCTFSTSMDDDYMRWM